MKANQATYPVRVMSRLLGVSASGFYAWARRPLSARAVEDIGLTALIHALHRRSDGAYGAPSIHAELADEHDHRVGKKRVARLMRAAGRRGLHPRRFGTTTVWEWQAEKGTFWPLEKGPPFLSCGGRRDVAGRSGATGGQVAASAIAVAPPVSRGTRGCVWRP